jgi:hypothetical protein
MRDQRSESRKERAERKREQKKQRERTESQDRESQHQCLHRLPERSVQPCKSAGVETFKNK